MRKAVQPCWLWCQLVGPNTKFSLRRLKRILKFEARVPKSHIFLILFWLFFLFFWFWFYFFDFFYCFWIFLYVFEVFLTFPMLFIFFLHFLISVLFCIADIKNDLWIGQHFSDFQLHQNLKRGWTGWAVDCTVLPEFHVVRLKFDMICFNLF